MNPLLISAVACAIGVLYGACAIIFLTKEDKPVDIWKKDGKK